MYLLTASHVIEHVRRGERNRARKIGLRSPENCPASGEPPDLVEVEVVYESSRIREKRDFAVLRANLTEDDPDYRPFKLYPSKQQPGALGEVFGWGFPLERFNRLPESLRGRLKEWNSESEWEFLQWMLEPANGVQKARPGMSGGPALVPETQGDGIIDQIVVGIIALERSDSEKAKADVDPTSPDMTGGEVMAAVDRHEEESGQAAAGIQPIAAEALLDHLPEPTDVGKLIQDLRAHRNSCSGNPTSAQCTRARARTRNAYETHLESDIGGLSHAFLKRRIARSGQDSGLCTDLFFSRSLLFDDQSKNQKIQARSVRWASAVVDCLNPTQRTEAYTFLGEYFDHLASNRVILPEGDSRELNERLLHLYSIALHSNNHEDAVAMITAWLNYSERIALPSGRAPVLDATGVAADVRLGSCGGAVGRQAQDLLYSKLASGAALNMREAFYVVSSAQACIPLANRIAIRPTETPLLTYPSVDFVERHKSLEQTDTATLIQIEIPNTIGEWKISGELQKREKPIL